MAVDDKEWAAAREVASRTLADKDGAPPSLLVPATVRYAFRARRASGAIEAVLVHGGRVVDEKGLAPLGAYLRGEQLLEGNALSVTEMLDLLYYLEAYPDVPDPRNYVYAAEEPPPHLASLTPRFEGTTFVLHYPVPLVGGPIRGSRYLRATLSIPSDYALSWSVETIDKD